MKIDFANPTIKKAGLTILFYLIGAGSIFILNKISPSGPCNPGLGVLAFMLLLIVSGIFFIISLIKVFQGNKTSRVLALIHFIALAFIVAQ